MRLKKPTGFDLAAAAIAALLAYRFYQRLEHPEAPRNLVCTRDGNEIYRAHGAVSEPTRTRSWLLDGVPAALPRDGKCHSEPVSSSPAAP